MHTSQSGSERAYRRTSLLIVILLAMAAWDCQVNCQGCCDNRDVAQEGTACATDEDCLTGESCVDAKCVTGDSKPATTASKKPQRRVNTAPPAEAAGFDKEFIGTSCKETSDCPGELMCASGSCTPAPTCSSDDACPKTMYCDQTLKRCRAPICITDEDCLGGQACDFGECVDDKPGCSGFSCPSGSYCNIKYYKCEAIDCTSDDDCAGERKCNNTSCMDCASNEDCPEGSECDESSGRCLEPKTCKTSEQCHHERVCDPDTNTCIEPPCTPDKYAGNDSRDNAMELRDGTYSFTRCERFGNDWFVFDLEKGEGFEIYGDYRKSRASLEFRIYAEGEESDIRRFVDSSAGGRVYSVFEAAPKTGTYYLRTKRSAEGATQYTMRFNRLENGRCNDDDLEPNNTMDKSYRIAANREYTGRYCSNEDWYSFDLGPGELAQVTMTIVTGPTPRLMIVEEPQEEGQEPRVLGQTSTDGNQLIRFKSEEGGNYHIRVFGEAKHSFYELRLKPLGKLPDNPNAGDDANRLDKIPEDKVREYREKFKIKQAPEE